ncbi:hypothetical protein [Bosea sp. MMO-172]|uniref:hypothetical protein n=1 Tax=Bosea sp. MMO-172 TaxID=3127885 RepID=UPI003015B442
MCFDPLSAALAIGGAAASGVGTKMQNDANNKAYRLNVFNEAIVDAKNREIDYANNERINNDIRAAKDIQWQALQQDAEEARVRNAVLKEFTDRQRAVADANAAAVAGAVPALGAAGTTAAHGAATQSRGDYAAKAIDSGGAVDPNFQGSTPDFVKRQLAAALEQGRSTVTDRARADAAVSAYGDVDQSQNTSIGDLMGKIGLSNNFAKGDLSLLPAEQELKGSLVRTPIYAPPPTLLQDRLARPAQIQPKTSDTGSLLKGLGSLAGSVAGSKSPVYASDGKTVTGYQPTAKSWLSTASSWIGS